MLNALEALKAPVEDQLAAVERGLLACGPPGSATTLEAKVNDTLIRKLLLLFFFDLHFFFFVVHDDSYGGF